jgi:hypothetical protein
MLTTLSGNTKTETDVQSQFFFDTIYTRKWALDDGDPNFGTHQKLYFDRKTVVTTTYQIQRAYSFDNGQDVLLIKMIIDIPSEPLWSGKQRRYKWEVPGLDQFHLAKEFWLHSVTANTMLYKNGSNKPMDRIPDSLVLADHSPTTVNRGNSESFGISVNLGLTAGYCGGATVTGNAGIT